MASLRVADFFDSSGCSHGTHSIVILEMLKLELAYIFVSGDKLSNGSKGMSTLDNFTLRN